LSCWTSKWKKKKTTDRAHTLKKQVAKGNSKHKGDQNTKGAMRKIFFVKGKRIIVSKVPKQKERARIGKKNYSKNTS